MAEDRNRAASPLGVRAKPRMATLHHPTRRETITVSREGNPFDVLERHAPYVPWQWLPLWVQIARGLPSPGWASGSSQHANASTAEPSPNPNEAA